LISLIFRKRRYNPYQKELGISVRGAEIVASERIHELTVCNGRQLACIDKLLLNICRNSLSNNGGRFRVYMVRVAYSRRWCASITFGTSEARSHICTADLTYDLVTIAHLSSNVTGHDKRANVYQGLLGTAAVTVLSFCGIKKGSRKRYWGRTGDGYTDGRRAA
jgi:hypothetical protein